MNPETKLQRRILLELSAMGCTCWRNETAGAWMGKTIHKDGKTVTLADARFMKFGLCVGSSDIIGITKGGLFFAIEVKTPKGKATKEQINFINHVRAQGGLAGIARSVEDARGIINAAKSNDD